MRVVGATHSLPQADGDSRPFDARQANGPVLVHVGSVGPAFGPPAEHVIKARDAAITAMVERMARLLYCAFQAHHLGLFDCIEFDDLSNAAKQKLVNDARCALHAQSPLYQSEVERQVRVTFQDGIDQAARHYPHLNPVADERVIAQRRDAMKHVEYLLSMIDMPTLFFVTQRHVLTEPLTHSPQKQVTLTMLRGGHRG